MREERSRSAAGQRKPLASSSPFTTFCFLGPRETSSVRNTREETPWQATGDQVRDQDAARQLCWTSVAVRGLLALAFPLDALSGHAKCPSSRVRSWGTLVAGASAGLGTTSETTS